MFGKGKRQKAQNLMATGAEGIGVVVNVQDTGMTMNDDPRVKMTFQIDPLDGSASFQAEKSSFVSRVQIPRIGDRYACWYDPADHSSWMFATVHDPDGQAQIRAMLGPQAETLTGFGGGVASAAPQPAAAAPPAGDPLDRLKKLDDLHKAGVLTDAEFAAKKAEILAEI